MAQSIQFVVAAVPVIPGPVVELQVNAVLLVDVIPVGFTFPPIGVGDLLAAGLPLEAALDSVVTEADPVKGRVLPGALQVRADISCGLGIPKFSQNTSFFPAKLIKDVIGILLKNPKLPIPK